MSRLDEGLAYSDSVRLTWEIIFSNESNLETAIDSVQQSDSASCKLASFGSETEAVMVQVGCYGISVS